MNKEKQIAVPYGSRDDVPHEDTARRAFALWQQRGRPAGKEIEIWEEAERQLHGADVASAPDRNDPLREP